MKKHLGVLALLIMLGLIISAGAAPSPVDASQQQQTRTYSVKCVDADDHNKALTDGQYLDLRNAPDILKPAENGVVFLWCGYPSSNDYSLIETRAPKGYLSNSALNMRYSNHQFNYSYNDTTGTIGTSDSGPIYYEYIRAPLLVKNVDEAGAPVAGAGLELLDSGGNVVAKWTSTDETDALDIVRPSYSYELPVPLIPGDSVRRAGPETFTVRVTDAASGYEKPADYIFLLYPDGSYDIKTKTDDVVKPGTMTFNYGADPGQHAVTDPIVIVHKKKQTENEKESSSAQGPGSVDPSGTKPDQANPTDRPTTASPTNEPADPSGHSKGSGSADSDSTDSGSDGSSRTGDSNSLFLWLGMVLVSLLVIGAVMLRRKHQSQ